MSISTAIIRLYNEGLFPIVLRKPFVSAIICFARIQAEAILHRAKKVADSPKYGIYRSGKGNLSRLQKHEICDILGEKSAASIDFQVMYIAIPEEQGSASAVEQQR